MELLGIVEEREKRTDLIVVRPRKDSTPEVIYRRDSEERDRLCKGLKEDEVQGH